MREISVTVNGQPRCATVPARLLLSDFLRDHLGLTGTHVGCEHGYCGSCTVHLDGRSVRSCLTFAVQTDGRTVDTVESLSSTNGALHPIQQALKDCHGLQCGFCTPGLLMSILEFIETSPTRDREAIREALAGNICRCTGYHQIVDAVQQAVAVAEEADSRDLPGRKPWLGKLAVVAEGADSRDLPGRKP